MLPAVEEVLKGVSEVIGGNTQPDLIGSGIGSATAGFDPAFNLYPPYEHTLRSYGLVFIFLPKVLKILLRTYSNYSSELLDIFEKYQHSFTWSVDVGLITVESEEIGSNRPLSRYRYPSRVTPPITINTTLIDAYSIFRCLAGETLESCAVDTSLNILQRTPFYKIVNQQNPAGRFLEELGVTNKGLRRNILRFIISSWIDFFEQLIFDNKQKGVSFKRQRGLTNPQSFGDLNTTQTADQVINVDNAVDLLFLRKLQQNNMLSKLLIEEPGLAYKGAVLVVRLTPERKPHVTDANLYVGAFPSQYTLIEFNWKDTEFELMSIPWYFDQIITGEHVINVAQELVDAFYTRYQPADQFILNQLANTFKKYADNLPKISDYSKKLTEETTSQLCLTDLGFSTPSLYEILKNPVEAITDINTPTQFKNTVNNVLAITNTARRTVRGIRDLL